MQIADILNMKINLEERLKPGYLVNRKALYSYGLTRPDVDYYVRSGFLISIAHGVYYRKSDYQLNWMEIVASLADLGYQGHVGGVSAVRESGLEHFVNMSDSQTPINLFSGKALPEWLNDKLFTVQLTTTKQPWLNELPDLAYRSHTFGQWNREIKYATIELALLEQLVNAKSETEIVAIDRQLEGMANLSPTRLNQLLLLCPSVKAKRLLGWLLERHNHAWIKHINWDNVNIGKGKRSIIKGGRYNDQWQITVPREMENQTTHGL